MLLSSFSPEEAKEVARKMLGHYLVTKQTGQKGLLCEEVLIAKRISIRREYYFSITLDRITNVSFYTFNSLKILCRAQSWLLLRKAV
jgi:succinyl-CoA synthetase beta subunit